MKIITKMEKLKYYLKEKGIKPTYQRLRILGYMSENGKNHPNVEMIYEKLQSEIPTISMTTIYNTLNTFFKKGLVCPVTITGTEVRYDFNTYSHHHFLCKKCGRIIDIDVKCPFAERSKSSVCGHQIEEVHGYFKGICRDCLKKGKKNKVKRRNFS